MKLNKKVQVRLSDDDYKQIEQEANRRGVSVSIILRERLLLSEDKKVDKNDTEGLLKALAPTLKKLVDYDKK